jgi:exodeoxyribonuclease-3
VIVSSINVNGVRAAIKQRSWENMGLLPWLEATTADVVCLQETRADDDKLPGALAPVLSNAWHLRRST